MPQAELIVIGFRLPRIFLAIITGASLAVAGAVMQGLLRNPLVSPFTLGLSSAASFGAAIAIVIGPGILGAWFLLRNDIFIVVMAFIFGWLSMLLVYGISRSRGTNQSTLILAGVVIGYLFQAGVMALKYMTNNDKLRDIVLWLMGGMWGASWNCRSPPAAAVPHLFFPSRTDGLGPQCPCSRGRCGKKPWHRCREIPAHRPDDLDVCSLLLSCVYGHHRLYRPHGAAHLPDVHRERSPVPDPLLGTSRGCHSPVSDTVARTIMSPVEIPVGIIMYIVGGIFFLFLILRGQGRGLY